ncbi:MAG: DEAD/DEAH box helicase [Candidatus Microthrix sp.]|nr:DEAD/DEAH box helicase [Candidatus Microthrix sp.]MBK9558126.1 DEAD/DEAH box helicase [Candidatus Microthrix sp.]
MAPRRNQTPSSGPWRRSPGALAGGGEERPGQVQMARAVAEAIADERHLVVQAGTGTGKSLAYLVPAVLSGKRTVVATATKALQDQLFEVDLPFLAAALDRRVDFAVLKGRSNYACLQRVDEVAVDLDQGSLELDDAGGDDQRGELARLVEWAETSHVGDKAELERDPSVAAWGAVSVGRANALGHRNAPSGRGLLLPRRRARAAAADVVGQHPPVGAQPGRRPHGAAAAPRRGDPRRGPHHRGGDLVGVRHPR